jgi:hypothetical protein
MTRSVFYSFHYKPDNHRAARIRSIGSITGNKPANDNDWESIKKGGDAAIRTWINGQLAGKSCAVVLVGAETAGRPWINYEIDTAWRSNKGVVGIPVHNMEDLWGNRVSKGRNPFTGRTVDSVNLGSVVKCYDPPHTTSSYVYNHIAANIANWIEEAISIRKNN